MEIIIGDRGEELLLVEIRGNMVIIGYVDDKRYKYKEGLLGILTDSDNLPSEWRLRGGV